MRWFVLASVALTVLLPGATWAQVTDSNYAFIFEEQCALCHGTTATIPNAVSREALGAFTPERVLEALTTGPMAPNASELSDEEKRGLAAYLTGALDEARERERRWFVELIGPLPAHAST